MNRSAYNMSKIPLKYKYNTFSVLKPKLNYVNFIIKLFTKSAQTLYIVQNNSSINHLKI